MKTSLKEITSNELKAIIENTVNILLNERHVIKLPKKETPMPPPMPQEPMSPMGGADPMGGDPNGMDEDPMGGDPNGIGDEGESDRDKLRKEVGNVAHLLQSDDIEGEDAKSALNTVIQQAKKKMDGSDLKQSANKLTNVGDASENGDGNGEPTNDDGGGQPMPQMESRMFLRNKINEMLNDFLDDDSIERQKKRKQQKEITNNRGYRNPFISQY